MSRFPSFVVRRALASDAEEFVRLRVEFLKEVNRAKAPDGLRESLRDYFHAAVSNEQFVGWFAVANGEIVGTSGVLFLQRAPGFFNISGREAYILNMYTLPSWRGRNVGRTLFHETLTYIQAQGITKISLHATEQGRRLYERFGFEVVTEQVEMTLHL